MGFIHSYLNWIYVAGGFVALFFGGEGLIRGAIALAERLHLPKLLIGLTIVGFGTSMPELLVSLKAVRDHAPDVAVGNVVGSNIANILLIAGLGALIRPMSTQSPGLKRDVLVMLAASIALAVLAWRGVIDSAAGMAMVGAIGIYLIIALITGRKAARLNETDAAPGRPLSIPLSLVFISVGMGLLVAGANFLVEGATAIASSMGVSQAIIGLTLVAVGTSLPELTVSVIGAVKGQNEVSLGNVLGSNIFNIFAVLGVTAWLLPIAVSQRFLAVDIPLLVAVSLAICVVIFCSRRVGRLTGLMFLFIYAAYMYWLSMGAEQLTALQHLLRVHPATGA
ncbi:hypothetical protein AEAC466_11785 [Asticcacaulis sp. AC466]|uniref:calcium/sodium antiporter n=1 Tax=Asticcacaulis sp. AC466 TaxID=1282362 RepID=UPI0003C3F33E|nr:calcium/sodium antiporter [Asticcacaulis sp. AC466]ESQ83680.1 hypothetical protein AEAC466_11785 [Asticcacaulis sp. AC466]